MLRETATPSNVIQSFQYGYDKVGNSDTLALSRAGRLWVQYADDADLTTYTANNLNQYTQIDAGSLGYNGNGSLSAYNGWTYLYDQAGNLIQAANAETAVTYTYDAIGRRLTRTHDGETTRYVYSGWQVIEERDGTGTLQAAYTWANGIDHPVRMVKDGNTYYYQQDALGNVTALTDSSGNLVERYEYDAFGAPTIYDSEGEELEAPLQPYLFTAREYDATTGLYDYRTRSYSPELGRFLQPDTIDFTGGDVNLYRYVRNSPVVFTDPRGTVAAWAVGLLAAAVITAAVLSVADFGDAASEAMAGDGAMQQAQDNMMFGGGSEDVEAYQQSRVDFISDIQDVAANGGIPGTIYDGGPPGVSTDEAGVVSDSIMAIVNFVNECSKINQEEDASDQGAGGSNDDY